MIDDGRNYFRVGSMKAGGALAKDGRVKPGDKLVWVDGQKFFIDRVQANSV